MNGVNGVASLTTVTSYRRGSATQNVDSDRQIGVIALCLPSRSPVIRSSGVTSTRTGAAAPPGRAFEPPVHEIPRSSRGARG